MGTPARLREEGGVDVLVVLLTRPSGAPGPISAHLPRLGASCRQLAPVPKVTRAFLAGPALLRLGNIMPHQQSSGPASWPASELGLGSEMQHSGPQALSSLCCAPGATWEGPRPLSSCCGLSLQGWPRRWTQ